MMRGKIVLLPFPFDDFSATKVRPALCLTDEIGPHGHVVVAFISSKLPALPEEFDLVMRQSDTGFLITGLRVDSVLKVGPKAMNITIIGTGYAGLSNAVLSL